MRKPRNIGAPIKLLAAFILLSALPLAMLIWLGSTFLKQDRALETQRLRERLENAAATTARDLDRAFAAWEKRLSSNGDTAHDLPAGSVLIVFDSKGVRSRQGVSLPYYPAFDPRADMNDAPFASAEALEFRREDFAGAAAAYRELSVSEDKRIRAGALMRLARSLRKHGKLKEALDAYGELVRLGDVRVAGAPAEVLGHSERIALFKSQGATKAASEETAMLTTGLRQGRFTLDRETRDWLEEFLKIEPSASSASRLADAVDELWPRFAQAPSGRTALTTENGAFAAVWQSTADKNSETTAVLVSELDSFLQLTIPQNDSFRIALVDRSGKLSWGSIQENEEHTTKTMRETGLPWTIQVAPKDSAAVEAAAASRRNLLFSGFALMLVVIAAASYFVFRSVHRELGVAQLQSDFVAAVSHEFRTPLTAMRHLTEMLEEGKTPPDRLSQYYRALGRETRRLHEMVESLLDFGRLESGRHTFHLEETDAAEFTERVVEDFRAGPHAGSHRVEITSSNGHVPQGLRIRADREALTLALRNLLDNAIKYSPESSVVRVSVNGSEGTAGISVQDEGCGIPKNEQRDVFRKFVRGSSAKTLNVKGAGIGLTMAYQIVRAHGGRLELNSQPGQGSRFTMLLPISG